MFNHGWWRLAVGGDWRWAFGGDCQLAVGGWWLAAVGGSWQLVMGGWWRLAAVDGWQLVAVGGWRRLAVGGWWQLAVSGCPLGRSLANKKRSGPLRTALRLCAATRRHRGRQGAPRVAATAAEGPAPRGHLPGPWRCSRAPAPPGPRPAHPHAAGGGPYEETALGL